MNVLHLYDASEPAETAGFRRIVVTEPTHPYVGAWWPPGHGLGYEHAFTHQAVDLVRDIAAGRDPEPSFADGLQVQRVLDAVETSSDSRAWQPIAH
jgi:predicted dehydrogenase